MRVLIGFRVHVNRFTGTLPEAIRTMTILYAFSTQSNDLTGVLPESGLEGMRSVQVFHAHRNRFAGTLPEDGFKALARVQVMAIDNNYLEGQMRLNMDTVVWGTLIVGCTTRVPRPQLAGGVDSTAIAQRQGVETKVCGSQCLRR
eukprot:3827738-Amphidinium_carterae.1